RRSRSPGRLRVGRRRPTYRAALRPHRRPDSDGRMGPGHGDGLVRTSAETCGHTACPRKDRAPGGAMRRARTPELLLEGLHFAEGPRWHDGKLWFSDIFAGRVMTVDES